MKKTLRQYLVFLRKHGYYHEADFYNREVVKIVAGVTGRGFEQVLDMPTKKVIEALIKAKDILNSIEVPKKEYDVELTA